MSISPYLHVLDGRVRIKVPAIKGAPQRALAIEQKLLALDGITTVTANPTTGNVLALFDPKIIGHNDIIAAIQKLGYLTGHSSVPRLERNNFLNFVVQSAVELVIERLVLTFI
jgi:copper chaperone CopZ